MAGELTPNESREGLSEVVSNHNASLLKAYQVHQPLLREHYGIEQTVMAGGYGYRQILELVQNGADAILEAHESGLPPGVPSRVHVMLRGSHLYVANTGAPLSCEGVQALLSSHSSPKRGNQIGRFGLGFKSLLVLGGAIDLFTTRSGAFRLDPARCRSLLSERFQVEETPGLRLAWPLDDDERRSDPVLCELGWAETVVRAEVRLPGVLDHLRTEILHFPPEFLLFFPAPVELVLDDGKTDARLLAVGHAEDSMTLRDGTESSTWRLFRREVRITDERAKEDATHIHARDTVPLAWAVPIDGRREDAGRFWAFFPTQTPTHVRGILNAPWKLNSDRNAIIGGDWNQALMAHAADLVASSLPKLRSDADPALPIDAFPRQVERRDDVAASLVEAIWAAIETASVIPDATGTLRQAGSLLRHPRDTVELAQRWQSLAGDGAARQLVHPKCLDRLRSARLEALARRLADKQGGRTEKILVRASPDFWFNAIASAEPARCVEVLKLAKAFSEDCKNHEWVQLRGELRIVPDSSGTLRVRSEIMLAPEGKSVGGLAVVDERLQSDPDAREILSSVLGVKPLGDEVWEDLLQERLNAVPWLAAARADKLWRSFWETLRAAPAGVRRKFVDEWAGSIRVRRSDGSWVTAEDALMPGEVVSADDQTESAKMLVDQVYHAGDQEELSMLGVTSAPEGSVLIPRSELPVTQSNALYLWRERCRSEYKIKHKNPAKREFLEPLRSFSMPTGWHLLPKLTGRAASRLTALYLKRLAGGEFADRLKFGHSTRDVYPTIEVDHPLLSLVLLHGRIAVGCHDVSLAALVARRSCVAMTMLPGWNEWLHLGVEKVSAASMDVQLCAEEVRALWSTVVELAAASSHLDARALAAVWREAAEDDVVPSEIPSRGGSVPLRDVYVTTSADLAARVREAGTCVVALDEATLTKWLERGAKDLSDHVKAEWAELIGPVMTLPSLIPELADAFDPERGQRARGQAARGLVLRLGSTTQPLPCLFWDGTLTIDVEQLRALPRARRLRLLIQEAAAAGLLRMSLEDAIDDLGNGRVDELRAAVREQGSLAERLLRAIGGRRDVLTRALDPFAALEIVRESSDLRLAELVLAHHGTATLNVLRDDLAEEGLRPPARWGGVEARAFVADIGFPESFAVAQETKREAEERITGPIELPPLHDFQREVFEAIESLLAEGQGRRRAVVSLPTGGGKTRVTVESAVRLVLAPEGGVRSVLWVAQTDELCEQAVQAFRQVWLNVGAPRTELRIARLWGGNPNPAPAESDHPVAVVASIQTLNFRMATGELGWLRKPGLVVVDECHHAITRSYTDLLHWLDIGASRPGHPAREEPPVLGLSATPFRSDDDESRRLARRFDGRWLPQDQESLFQRLLERGVLSMPRYEPLDSGAGLLPEEEERLARLSTPWEGVDFENILEAINQRLAGDRKRNERLVGFLGEVPEKSILFFANSVTHAQEMALRLNHAGVPTAAVSGDTPTSTRRDFIRRFQSGQLRVLCNHSVLTTGFDAPKADMVLIARQVFSPVRYMQMVGRGLRGERNGGTRECRIVTVMDNLGRFQDRHPHHYCRRYFTGLGDTQS